MKKYSGYILAGLWFLLGFIALSFFISWLVNDRNPFDIRGFKLGSESTTVENYNDASINSIDISLISERIIITGSNRNDFEISISSNFSEEFRPKASVKDGVLYITQKSKRSFISFFSNGYVEVLVPLSVMKRENFNIEANSVSGSVTLSDCTAQRVRISSTSGSIRGSNLFTTSINGRSVSGSVKMDDCEVNDLNLSSTSGSVSFVGSCDYVTATSVSGSVKIHTSSMLTQDSDLKSMSGSVRLYLPNNDGFVFIYSSMSGSVRNSFTDLDGRKSGKETYKDGGITLNLESMSGSVSVERY